MRKLILATVAVLILGAPLASSVRAEDSTTVIKRGDDADTSKTIIKKHDDTSLLPIPHTEEKTTIIKKDGD